ncbi:MAG: hypothetical protein ACYSWQ_00220 [Planctomycetota bacterium]
MIEHVSYLNSRYGGQHGWKLSSRCETSLKNLSEKMAAFRQPDKGRQEKDEILLELIDAKRKL